MNNYSDTNLKQKALLSSLPSSLNLQEGKAFCLSACYEINDFFQPLFKLLGIHGFTFQRIFNDEYRIFLTNSTEWAENSFQKQHLFVQNYKNYSKLSEYLLWARWPDQDKKAIELIKDARNFNYDNALSITRHYNSYIDLFALRGFNNDNEVNYRYFPNLEIINKFIDFFLAKNSDLIQKALKSKMLIFNPSEIKSFPNSLKTANNYLSNLLPQGGNKLLHPITAKPFLTQREEDCVKAIASGKTLKEVANELNISARTVEQYLNKVKLKMQTTNKSKLINSILSLEYNKRIIFDH